MTRIREERWGIIRAIGEIRGFFFHGICLGSEEMKRLYYGRFMSRPTRIQSVKLVGKFEVCLGLTNGTTKVVDLERFLKGPIFEPIRNDPGEFAKVTVDSPAGTIVWPNGADIDPDVLCEDLQPC